MKKPTAALIIVALVGITTALPSEAGGRRHYQGHNKNYNKSYNNGGVNGWAAAAIGAVVGVAIGSAIANNQSSNNYYNSQPNYVSRPSPQYYRQQACVTTQVPVYDQFGRIVQYRQVCAN